MASKYIYLARDLEELCTNVNSQSTDIFTESLRRKVLWNFGFWPPLLFLRAMPYRIVAMSSMQILWTCRIWCVPPMISIKFKRWGRFHFATHVVLCDARISFAAHIILALTLHGLIAEWRPFYCRMFWVTSITTRKFWIKFTRCQGEFNADYFRSQG